MKMLFGFFATLVLVSTTAHAASNFELPITRGHMQIGGGFSYDRHPTYESTNLAPNAEYFIIDHLSIGGSVAYRTSHTDSGSTSDESFLGPSATFYFYQSNPIGLYVTQSVLFSKSHESFGGFSFDGSSTTDTTGVGVSVFASASAAFGIEAAANYGPNQGGYFSLLGAFHFFL